MGHCSGHLFACLTSASEYFCTLGHRMEIITHSGLTSWYTKFQAIIDLMVDGRHSALPGVAVGADGGEAHSEFLATCGVPPVSELRQGRRVALSSQLVRLLDSSTPRRRFTATCLEHDPARR